MNRLCCAGCAVQREGRDGLECTPCSENEIDVGVALVQATIVVFLMRKLCQQYYMVHVSAGFIVISRTQFLTFSSSFIFMLTITTTHTFQHLERILFCRPSYVGLQASNVQLSVAYVAPWPTNGVVEVAGLRLKDLLLVRVS
jgi:hypothetical protein